MRRGFGTRTGGAARGRRRFYLRIHGLQARPKCRQGGDMSALPAPHLEDRLPLWEVARRWAAGDELRAKDFYARLWAGYWQGEFLTDAFQFWVRAAPDAGTFLSMP